MYRKNVAGQFICVQLILTATGAVATGLSLAARRCIDGTFAAGGGTFTEDGTTGSYKYALAQADTNGNDISIIVTATGAIPVCVNFVTTAADPTDSVRFGLTGLPNAVPGATGGLFIAGTNAATTVTTALTTTFTGNLTGSVGSVTGAVGSVTGAVGSVGAGGIAASTFAAGAIDATAIAADAIGASELAADAVAEIADGILNRDMSTGTDSGSPTVRTMRQALRFLRNKWSISGTTLTVTKEDDTTASWTSTLAGTAGADPITSSDPA